MRKFLIGGNWKCNGSLAFAQQFPAEVLNKLNFSSDKCEVVVAPTHFHLSTVKNAITHPNVHVATQNLSLTGNGAFTGEHSVEMIRDMGVNWTLTGHSERRTIFGETDKEVATKTRLALEGGFGVLACIGETLEEREAGNTRAVNE